MMTSVLMIIFAYAIGSLSSAVLICRLLGLPDPRTAGSKNPGATNVLRIGNRLAAFLTLFGDLIKGVIPVLLAKHLQMDPWGISGVILAVFLGHLYPLYFGFKGGKGVATALGVLLALYWPLGVGVLVTWIVVVSCFRWSSLGALVAAWMAPWYAYWLVDQTFVWVVSAISGFLFWRHRTNIKRLWTGKEPKIGR